MTCHVQVRNSGLGCRPSIVQSLVRNPSLIIVALASSSACSLSTSNPTLSLEAGTVRVVAYNDDGVRAAGADVIVHSPDGQMYGRAKLESDGTGVVDSVAGATISVATTDGYWSTITTYTQVPLDASLQFSEPWPNGHESVITVQLPEHPGGHYEVHMGCGDSHVGWNSPTIQVHAPASCKDAPRTIIAVAEDQGYNDVAVSVRYGVDLTQPGPITMPAWQPFEQVTLSIEHLEEVSAQYFSRVTVFNEGGSYLFWGGYSAGSTTINVPPGSFTQTMYEHHLSFDDLAAKRPVSDQQDVEQPPHRGSIIDRFAAGPPQSDTVDARDFLAAPRESAEPLFVDFEGEPDARSVELFYGALKSAPHHWWKIYGPAVHETFTLPEMPPDLRELEPDGDWYEDITAEIHDASEANTYAEWINVHHAQVPGTTRSRGAIYVHN
jgi:hypothetical protein